MMFMWFPKDVLYYLTSVYLLPVVPCLVELPLQGLHMHLYFQSFFSINLPTLHQCVDLCVAYKLCRNLAFDRKSGYCELNSDDPDRQYPWISSLNPTFIKKKEIPQGIGGACSGHTCAIDEMCMSAGMAYVCVKHGYPTVRCLATWGRHGDLCFTITTGTKTWLEAKDYCASTGAELLTFDSSVEYNIHMKWIHYRMVAHTSLNPITSGMIWTGMTYSPPMPLWMNFNPPETNDTNLCIGMQYNRTGKWETLQIGVMEAVSCDEKNGFACQHRNPDHWP